MSSFEIVLDHTPIVKIISLERMMAVIAIPDLDHILHGIVIWIRGIYRDIEVVVHSWLEEPIPLTPPLDSIPKKKIIWQSSPRQCQGSNWPFSSTRG